MSDYCKQDVRAVKALFATTHLCKLKDWRKNPRPTLYEPCHIGIFLVMMIDLFTGWGAAHIVISLMQLNHYGTEKYFDESNAIFYESKFSSPGP